MWSDRLSAAKKRRLIERLHAVLPAPDPHGRGAVTPLRLPGPKITATVEQMAEELRNEPGFAWLDGGGGNHRFFVRPLAVLSVRNGRATVIGQIQPIGPISRITVAAGGFDLLEAAFAAWGGPARALLVGYLGYELAAELETLEPASPADLEDDLKLPDLHLALYDEALCHDGHHDGGGWRLESTDAWHTRGDAERVRDAEARLAAARKREVPEPETGRLAMGPVTGRPNARGFMAAVERTVSRIRRGQIYQANVCRRLEAKLPADRLWPLWQRLRAASPADHGAWLSLTGRADRNGAVLSVSPELFLSVREGIVTTQPIKGTRPRGATPREDRALARELAESAKDQAELAMIVDVARNDLGRVCTTGSVEVVRHAELMTLPTLHHLVSTVRGRLPASDSVSLLRAAFPPASITGAPKIQAIIVAASEEERRRGPAMGALGWLSLGGDLELSVAIRTAAAAGGRIAYHAGCGITADSDPELELEETAVKARAFLTALGASESP
ncbi:MAG TPA: anthranilate synthase component I family protein [Thermoanaerobaculia bacterium]|jgi:para-aminobenzoate synthetase component 1|nr:anthranilate synthase component I family protein [Thermoanaerobaculia bacterium]